MDRAVQPSKSSKVNLLSIIIILAIVIIASVLIIICLVELTNREATLLGTFLTFLSVGIGWGISHLYSSKDKEEAIAEVREFHQRNLRTYALKAAEKVTNLSKELNRLSAYLQEELQYNGYRNENEELFAKEERIESAIHILGSLRSVNDTSLSDWQGVIGEELDEQRQTEEDKAEQLGELADRISALEVAPIQRNIANPTNDEIDELKKQVRGLAAEISVGTFRAKSRPTFQHVETTCPACLSPISYGQRAKENDKKSVQCKSCETNLISTYREASGFMLTVREQKEEQVSCPSCSADFTVLLDEWPSASTVAHCADCGEAARISRSSGGKLVKVTVLGEAKAVEPLTADIIQQVRTELPLQPWPKGVHQSVADTLRLRPTTVQKAIQHLIRTGVFQDQVDGAVCTTAEKLALLRSSGTRL
jgi:flagellar basal body-associated protein FliL